MPLTTPKTRGFLLNFHGLKIIDIGGDDVGIREMSLKLTMAGKGPVWGKNRIALGFVPGRPVWTTALKWELSHWTRWLQRHPGYMDEIFDYTFDYQSKGLNYTIELIGCTPIDDEHTANGEQEGGIERPKNFAILDVKQLVDGVEIPYLQDITQ
jgi:hypothetical protein